MTIRDVAARFGLHQRTIYRDIQCGYLKAEKLGKGRYELCKVEVYQWLVGRFQRCGGHTAEAKEWLAKNGGAA